ncbi:MAG TPA: endolytic transglycosylase MltG [Clostridia bacterium]|nr:endolytic transglycosylase MltG [Clostridia bacterium]
MKTKVKKLVALLLALGLFCLVGCDALDEFTAPKETVTARPTVRVTVPEGFTVYKIAQLLEEKGVCSSDDFIAAVNAPAADNALGNTFAAAIPNAAERPFLLEGYVFPDTYDFYVGETAEKALDRFLSNMNAKFTPDDYARAEELGYTMDEIIIIASLIQAEAGTKKDDAKVSAVIHNRLGSKDLPRLQLDASYKYLDKLENDDEGEAAIPDAREKYDELYNTYVCKRLPAGPICNPGKGSITAALYPATLEETDGVAYYYYFSYAGKNFYYSTNYADHNREYNIRRYWKTATG